MNRFLVKIKLGHSGYDVLDDKTNIIIAHMVDLWRAQEYIEYLNKKEALKVTILNQVSKEIDEEFK